MGGVHADGGQGRRRRRRPGGRVTVVALGNGGALAGGCGNGGAGGAVRGGRGWGNGGGGDAISPRCDAGHARRGPRGGVAGTRGLPGVPPCGTGRGIRGAGGRQGAEGGLFPPVSTLCPSSGEAARRRRRAIPQGRPRGFTLDVSEEGAPRGLSEAPARERSVGVAEAEWLHGLATDAGDARTWALGRGGESRRRRRHADLAAAGALPRRGAGEMRPLRQGRGDDGRDIGRDVLGSIRGDLAVVGPE